MTHLTHRLAIAAALAMGIAAMCHHARAADDAKALPVAKVEVVGVPVRTARLCEWGLAPKAGGGHVMVMQFMNYRGTTEFTFERKKLPDTGREYVVFSNPELRPDAEWVVLDLQTGEATVQDLPGFHSTQHALAANGRLFFGVDFFHIHYYDPADGKIHILGQLEEWKPFTNNRIVYKFSPGPDGMIYGTTQSYDGKTTLVQINPDTLDYRLFKGLGSDERGKGLTYGYYMAVRPPWAYVAVGQGNWELVALNLDTGESKVLDKAYGDGTRITISDVPGAVPVAGVLQNYAEGEKPPAEGGSRRDGHVMFTPKSKTSTYRLIDGQKVPAPHGDKTQPPTAPVKQIEWTRTSLMPAGDLPEIDVRSVTVAPTGQVTLRWRPAGASGDADWRNVSFNIRRSEPATVVMLSALPDGSVFGAAAAYQGFFRYHQDGRLDFFGKHGPSGPKAAMIDGKLYFQGYPNVQIWGYDPDRPWTSKGDSKVGLDTNPRLFGYFGQGVTEAHHSRFIVAAPGGRLYFAGHRERWSTGTGLGYFEPATGKRLGLGTAMKELEPEGLAVLPTAQRVVVSGRSIGKAAGTDASLRLFDMELNEVAAVPLRPGLDRTGRLYNVGHPTHALGVVQTDTVRMLYLLDVESQKVISSRDLPAPVQQAVVHRPADDTYWMIQEGTLCRLDVKSLELHPVATLDNPIGGNLVWQGHTLFGSIEGEVRRVRP